MMHELNKLLDALLSSNQEDALKVWHDPEFQAWIKDKANSPLKKRIFQCAYQYPCTEIVKDLIKENPELEKEMNIEQAVEIPLKEIVKASTPQKHNSTKIQNSLLLNYPPETIIKDPKNQLFEAHFIKLDEETYKDVGNIVGDVRNAMGIKRLSKVDEKNGTVHKLYVLPDQYESFYKNWKRKAIGDYIKLGASSVNDGPDRSKKARNS